MENKWMSDMQDLKKRKKAVYDDSEDIDPMKLNSSEGENKHHVNRTKKDRRSRYGGK